MNVIIVMDLNRVTTCVCLLCRIVHLFTIHNSYFVCLLSLSVLQKQANGVVLFPSLPLAPPWEGGDTNLWEKWARCVIKLTVQDFKYSNTYLTKHRGIVCVEIFL